MKKKTILFGIDGAPFSIIDQYRDRLPTFDHIMKSGARSTLLSTVPAVTVPSWTSMFTGVNPGKHGITDFILKIDGRFAMATSNYRMVDTLWNIVGRKGLKSIVVNDPSTFPPDNINGIMTTGLMTPPGVDYVSPKELKNDLERVTGGYWTDLPLEYYHTVNKDDKKAYSMIEEFANKTAKVGTYLAQNNEWDLLAVIFVSTDKIQHTLWHKPDYLLRHYMQIDNILKDYLDLANRENANILIVSDHGFGPLRKTFYINTWLANVGLQNRKTDMMSIISRIGISPSRVAVVLKKLHLYDFALRKLMQSERLIDAAFQYDRPIDLHNSIAFAKAEGIFIRNDSNVDADNSYEKTRRTIMEKLKDLEDDGMPLVSEIYKREEILHGAYIDRAPDILFTLNDGYCPTYYSDGSDSNYLGDDKGGYKGGTANTGIHRPEGIFIGYGSDIRNYHIKEESRVWDVTPTILHMMGLPVPSYMDGRVLTEIFRPESNLGSRPIRRETNNEADRIKNRLRGLRGS